MVGTRILLYLVAFVVVIGEMVIGQKAPDKFIWIVPGGLVIGLLISMSLLMLSGPDAQSKPPQGGLIQWVFIVASGMAISAVSFYLPLYILPFLVANS